MRRLIKKYAPTPMRTLVHALRKMLEGEAIEEATLRKLRLIAEDRETAPRLNLVLPTLSAKSAFGGVHTAIDLTLALIERLNGARPFDLRFISDAETAAGDNVLEQFRSRINSIAGRVTQTSCEAGGNSIATRKHDIFIAFNWWTNINIMPILDEQARHFSIKRRPRLYIIQDYEPHFYPFSSTHLYALHAYQAPDDLYGIFNSTQLQTYFRSQGHETKRSFVFEPKLPSAMRPYQQDLNATPKKKSIVVYGRPNVNRNCFSLLVEGLKQFLLTYPEYESWAFLSVGTTHRPIRIGTSATLQSIGKLSIENYAQLLRESAIGISLMASPHPSYPPLEMANFGMLTITNKYANKDLESEHPNIRSLPDIMPATLAEQLAMACADFEDDPRAGVRNAPAHSNYLSGEAFECIDDLTSSILELVN